MRRALPFLLALLLIGGGLYLLLGGPDDGQGVDVEAPEAPTGAVPDEASEAAGPVALAPQAGPPPPGAAAGQKPATSEVVDPRALPRGRLTVEVLGPDDQRLAGEDLTVKVAPGRGAGRWHVTPSLRYDPDTRLWSSDEVRVGDVRVHVFGESIVPADVETVVTREPGETLRIHVDRAGRIEYVVTTFANESPGEVDVTLLGPNRRPQLAYYQVRTATVLTQPQRAREVRQGPEGVIFGVPPGRYTLRVTSAAGEYEESEVEVAALATVKVGLRVRR